jgi:dienelactone hydrolase
LWHAECGQPPSTEFGGLSLKRRWGMALVAACGIGAACVPSPAGAAPGDASRASGDHGVGVIVETFVDHSRTTPAHNGQPGFPSRTLVTTIWYPAAVRPSARPKLDAEPDTADGPYPLIVFSHGLGTVPSDYEALLSTWAAAGFVVAAPKFPLTSFGTPGGVDTADVYNQPGDVSFVISVLLLDSAARSDPLSGMISPTEIGVAGHSEGAITTLGFFNTCCRDPRVKAAAVFSGDPEAYPGGHYVFDGQPPMLVVHGTNDGFLPYGQMVSVFNEQKGPKVLLSLLGANHGNWERPRSKWFPSVARTSTDFFRRYLEGSTRAGARIFHDAQPGVATVHYAPKPGQSLTVTPPPAPRTHRRAAVTPSKGLADGQLVTVRWSGYLPGNVVNVVECSGNDETDCDLATGRILVPDALGSGSVALRVVDGRVGAGVCGSASAPCSVYVNDAGLLSPSATIRLPIAFASDPDP